MVIGSDAYAQRHGTPDGIAPGARVAARTVATTIS
jgi:hypothetical protein